MGSNGILECKFLSENAHRAVCTAVPRLLQNRIGRLENARVVDWFDLVDDPHGADVPGNNGGICCWPITFDLQRELLGRARARVAAEVNLDIAVDGAGARAPAVLE